MTLSELTVPVRVFPQLLVNVRVVNKPAAKSDPDVEAAVKNIEKALGSDGRILLRESGTEPVLRVMVEAESDEICQRHVYEVIDVLKEKGHVIEG